MTHLFHDLVNGYSVILGHFVELIDTHYTSICQHHGSSLQPSFSRLWIHCHCRRQSDPTASSPAANSKVSVCALSLLFSPGADGQGSGVEDEAKHLRLGCAGVPDEHDVDVASNVSAVLQILF